MKLVDIVTFTRLCEEEWLNDELFEMANIHSDIHGIQDIVIWVGRANKQHGLRIKVSNKKNKFDATDHFVIQMPSLDYDPRMVAKWITPQHIQLIFNWIKLNQQLLFDYENDLIDNTKVFLSNLSSV